MAVMVIMAEILIKNLGSNCKRLKNKNKLIAQEKKEFKQR